MTAITTPHTMTATMATRITAADTVLATMAAVMAAVVATGVDQVMATSLPMVVILPLTVTPPLMGAAAIIIDPFQMAGQ